MNQFSVSTTKQTISRVIFYSVVLITCGVIGEMLPSEKEMAEQWDRRMGIPKAYYGVPLEQVKAELQAAKR